MAPGAEREGGGTQSLRVPVDKCVSNSPTALLSLPPYTTTPLRGPWLCDASSSDLASAGRGPDRDPAPSGASALRPSGLDGSAPIPGGRAAPGVRQGQDAVAGPGSDSSHPAPEDSGLEMHPPHREKQDLPVLEDTFANGDFVPTMGRPTTRDTGRYAEGSVD